MKQLRNLIFLNCIIFIYGCESLPSFDEVLPDKRTTYRKSKDLPELEVPPDLTVTKGDYSAELPSDRESTSLNEFERQRSMREGGDIILGSGDFEGEQWIALRGSTKDIWEKLREFWQKNSYKVYLDDVELGVFETDWKETKTIKQKFKILTEPSEGGGVILFLSSERQELSEGDWLVTQPDNLAEKDIINKLNLHFNENILTDVEGLVKDDLSARSVDKEFSEVKAKILNNDEGNSYLEVNENFNLVIDNTNQVIEQAGYFLENSDPEKGVYSFRYFRPQGEEDEEGFFSKLKFWGDDEGEEGLLYQLILTDVNDKTEIAVLNENGEPETGKDALDILVTIERIYNKIL